MDIDSSFHIFSLRFHIGGGPHRIAGWDTLGLLRFFGVDLIVSFLSLRKREGRDV